MCTGGGLWHSLSLSGDRSNTHFYFSIFLRVRKRLNSFGCCWLLAASRFLFFATARLPPQRRGVYLTRNSDHLRRIERKEVIFGGKPKKKKSGQCQAVQFFYLKKKKKLKSFIRRPPSNFFFFVPMKKKKQKFLPTRQQKRLHKMPQIIKIKEQPKRKKKKIRQKVIKNK